MLQKFNITTYAVVLCLFGFMLFTAAPVFADPQGDFEECQSIKPKGVDFDLMKDKKNCFRDIAEELLEINENLRTGSNNDASGSDDEGRDVCEMSDAELESNLNLFRSPLRLSLFKEYNCGL